MNTDSSVVLTKRVKITSSNPVAKEDFVKKIKEFAKNIKIMSIPQAYFICNQKGQIMVKHIARFENFENEFKALMKYLSIENCDNCILNVSNNKQWDYHKFYDTESKELIANRYKVDIQMFNYKY